MAIDIKLTYSNEPIKNIPSDMAGLRYFVIDNKYICFIKDSFIYIYQLNNLVVGEHIFTNSAEYPFNLRKVALRNNLFYYLWHNISEQINEQIEVNLDTKITNQYILDGFYEDSIFESSYNIPNNKYFSKFPSTQQIMKFIYKENGLIKYDTVESFIGHDVLSVNPYIYLARYDYGYEFHNFNDEKIGEITPNNLGYDSLNYFCNFGINNFFYLVFVALKLDMSKIDLLVLKYDTSNIQGSFNDVERKSFNIPQEIIGAYASGTVQLLNNENIVLISEDGSFSYTLSVADTPDTFKGTINFADGGTNEHEFDYEIGYIESEYLLRGQPKFKFYDVNNKLKDTITVTNADSYKYAETITINDTQYPINTKQQITINSDFTIQVNNGVVAFYNVTFKNDTVILQNERLQEETLPTYKGATPTKEGYVFTGWEPTPYPVDKHQDYQATFEMEPYDITIVDSAGDTENFTVIELGNGLTQINKIITDLEIVNAYLGLNLLVRYKDTIYEEGKYDSIALILYKVGSVGEFSGFTIEGIIENGVFGQVYSNLNIDKDITISIEVVRAYLIRFLDYDGSLLEQNNYKTGLTPQYSGGEPTREGYDFTGRNPSIEPVSKNQDYTATYTIKTYTIRFLNEDGSVLETQNLTYGTTPVYGGEIPTKEGYTFNGWTPTLYPANKNQDYKPTFRNNAFSVTLYKNSAENNRIDKNEYLTNVGEIEGYLRQETNIINPSIVIEYDKVIDFNYVYISTFNRYYFVNNITSVRTNLWRLDMSCDVLMTYRDTILNYECYVSRNENLYNEDIEDNYLPLEYEKVAEVTNLYNDTYNYGKVFLEGKYSVVFTTIYTGTEYTVDDEQVETEFQDLEGNILEVSSISLGASNYRCMGIIKNNILGTLNKLIEKTINADDLASYIISLIVFPVDGNELIVGALTPEKLLIKNDDTSITVTQGDVSYPNGGVLKPILANQFTITPKYNNFLDYEPYTTYEIYLPFYGWLKLNSYQILNEQLVVTYCPQVDSEQCSIIISKGSFLGKSREVIAEVTCQLGIQIPINSTNVERINREKTANVLNSVVGGITGVAMAGAGAATGNPFMAMAGGMTAIGSITSGISKDMTLLPSAQSKSGSSYDGAMSDRTFKLRITYPKIAVDDLTKYAKYIGRPLQTNVKLNTLSGFTIVGGVHVENLGTATDNEKTDIENKLRKGVII